MPDNDGVLSQEQIDAMLSGGNEEPVVNLTPTNLDEIRASGTPLQAAAAAAAVAPTPAPAPAADTGAITDLANRVARLEASVSQAGASAADVQGILAQLQELSSKVEGMMTGMQGTVGYGARQTFVCSSCQNQGHVAAKLNCTVCGEDNWWGWWPPQQQ